MSPLDGPAVTVDRGTLDCCALGGGLLQGGRIYWTQNDSYGVSLYRRRVSARPACWQGLEPHQGFPAHAEAFNTLAPEPGFAIDGTRLFYADDNGVFEMARERLRWRDSGYLLSVDCERAG